MNVKMIPIPEKRELINRHLTDEFYISSCKVYEKLYTQVGYQFPWVGYLVLFDDELVGTGGFRNPPVNNQVEITYQVSPDKKGPGYATRICHLLSSIALKQDPGLRVKARNSLGDSASESILKKLGFKLLGKLHDPDEGPVIEWELDKSKFTGRGRSN
jgi:RimJ/RimL family protein N-acetyltransferase